MQQTAGYLITKSYTLTSPWPPKLLPGSQPSLTWIWGSGVEMHAVIFSWNQQWALFSTADTLFLLVYSTLRIKLEWFYGNLQLLVVYVSPQSFTRPSNLLVVSSIDSCVVSPLTGQLISLLKQNSVFQVLRQEILLSYLKVLLSRIVTDITSLVGLIWFIFDKKKKKHRMQQLTSYWHIIGRECN